MLRLIQGESIEEKIQSIDQILCGLNKKPMKNVINVISKCPKTIELPVAEVVYPIMVTGLSGTLGDIMIYVSKTKSKEAYVLLNIQTEGLIQTVRTKVKAGFTKNSDSYSIKGNTIITASYLVGDEEPITPPIIGFTFKENVEDVN